MSGRSLIFFVARRLITLSVLLVIISFAVFSLLYISPGNIIDILLGNTPRTPETVRALQQKYHLDKPFLTQYWIWAKAAAQFHFGNSIQTTLPVTDEIKARLPTSLFLGAYAWILTNILGVGLGLGAAFRHRRTADRAIAGGAMVASSMPPFVSGVLLLYLFAIVVHWFPVAGRGTGFFNDVWHLTLPAVSLSLIGAAYVLKHTRAAVIRVLDQDYVAFARARGLSARRVLFAYTLRNALIPVVTISGLLLAHMIAGAVLIEVVFSLPGIGSLLVQSATIKDLPMLQGVAIVVAVVIMVANLLVDLAYIAIDPRIRFQRHS